MEAAEPTPPLDKVFPERALGLCPKWRPVLPAGVRQSSWASGSLEEPGQVLPAEVVTHLLTGSPAKAQTGTDAGAGQGGHSH